MQVDSSSSSSRSSGSRSNSSNNAAPDQAVSRASDHTLCDYCQKLPHNDQGCSQCSLAMYCSGECQSKHWKELHSVHCQKTKQVLEFVQKVLILVNEDTQAPWQQLRELYANLVECGRLLAVPLQHLHNKVVRDLEAKRKSCLRWVLHGKNRYKLIRCVRETIFGQVFVAQDLLSSGTLVAVKSSNMSRINARNTIENPREELRLHKLLTDAGQHPHILQLLDIFEHQNNLCSVLEFCSKGDLLDLIQHEGRVHPRLAIVYARQIASALEFMHRHDICHLDLTCENVMVKERPQQQPSVPTSNVAPTPASALQPDQEQTHITMDVDVQEEKEQEDGETTTQQAQPQAAELAPGLSANIMKVIDFGQARQYRTGERWTGIRGKLGYMDPLIYDQLPYDGKEADCYSLGVIIFMLVTGFAPYSQEIGPKDPRCKLILRDQGCRTMLQGWKMLPSIKCPEPPEGKQFVDIRAVDLLDKLLCHHSQRLTIGQVLEHPWLAQQS